MITVTKSAFWINFAKAVRKAKERRTAGGGMRSKRLAKPMAAAIPTKRERDPLTSDVAASPMLRTAKERKRVSTSDLSGAPSTMRVYMSVTAIIAQLTTAIRKETGSAATLVSLPSPICR